MVTVHLSQRDGSLPVEAASPILVERGTTAQPPPSGFWWGGSERKSFLQTATLSCGTWEGGERRGKEGKGGGRRGKEGEGGERRGKEGRKVKGRRGEREKTGEG